MKSIKFLVLFVVVILSNGCGEGFRPIFHEEPTKAELIQEDLARLNATSPEILKNYDEKNQNILTKIFGGSTSEDIMKYFEARIKYSVTDNEIKAEDVTPHPLEWKHTGWNKSEAGGDTLSANNRRGTVMASNIGTALWFQSMLEGKTFTLDIRGKPVEIESTRTGIMRFGAGYRRWGHTDNGWLLIPNEVRILTLIHEARHSDCTGGIKNADLEVARKAKSHSEFQSKFNRFQCGHLHVPCPSGHSYEGINACDRHPWGAYAVGAVYSKLSLATVDGVDKDIMDAVTLDMISRVNLEFTAMMNGAHGEPDMTSSGLIEE